MVAECRKWQSNVKDGGSIAILFSVETLFKVGKFLSSRVSTFSCFFALFFLGITFIFYFFFRRTFLRVGSYSFWFILDILSLIVSRYTRLLWRPVLTWECVRHYRENTIF